jgi:hypothetical protein
MLEIQSKGQPFSGRGFPDGPCPHCGIRLRYTKAVKWLTLLVLLYTFPLGFLLKAGLLSPWLAVILALALLAIVGTIRLGISFYEVVGED